MANQIPHHRVNSEIASDLLYEILASSHRDSLGKAQKNYPIVQDVETSDLGSVRLRFTQTATNNFRDDEWRIVRESSTDIIWKPHLSIKSGIDSGIYVIPKFGELRVVESPFDSLRNSNNFSSALDVTFVSSSVCELGVSENGKRSNLKIPGDGAFVASMSPHCDIFISSPGVTALVLFNESRQ
jgi:hypothetical protein